MNVLAIDVGGPISRCSSRARREPRVLDSRPAMTPGAMVKQAKALVADWPYRSRTRTRSRMPGSRKLPPSGTELGRLRFREAVRPSGADRQ